MLDYYINNVSNQDYQRTNLFSVAICDGPGKRQVSTFDGLITPLFQGTWVQDFGNSIGFGLQDMAGFVDNEINSAIDKAIRRSTTAQQIMAAMDSRIVTSLLGGLGTEGQVYLDYFSGSSFMEYSVKGVKLPETSINASYKLNENFGYSISLGERNNGQLVVTFRRGLGPMNIELKNGADNYQVWQEYVNAVTDQEGLSYFFDDVYCNVQVNEHDRNGLPHTVHVFDGCIPISVGELNYDWDSTGEIQTFDVVFMFKRRSMGRVGQAARIEWGEKFLAGLAGAAGRQMSGLANKAGSSIRTTLGNVSSGLLSSANSILGGSGKGRSISLGGGRLL